MRPVEIAELLGLSEYENVRDQVRGEIIAIKNRRRVLLGSNMSVLFENRDTVRYQVQEMLRVERIESPDSIRQELEVYNELVPGKGELSATLLIEYPTAEEREVRLVELRGLEDGGIRLQIGANAFPATFDSRQIGVRRISSVHYLKFHIGEAAAELRLQGLSGGVKLVADHPAYRAEVVLKPETVLQLVGDLTAG